MNELRDALSHINSSAPGPDFIPANFFIEMNGDQQQQIFNFL